MKVSIDYPIPEYAFQRKQLAIELIAKGLPATCLEEIIESLQEMLKEE